MHFIIRPSKWLSLLVGLLYCFTGISILCLPLSFMVKGLGILLHSMHFYTIWYYFLSLNSKESIVYLHYTKQKTWIIGNQAGEAHEAILKTGSFCTAYLVILHLQSTSHQGSLYVCLLPDSLLTNEFRLLRKQLSLYL